jgi:hypothetical protein
MFHFPYTKLPSVAKKEVYAPLAKVRLSFHKTHKITPVPVASLIDSGADVCFCADYIGIWLGIQLSRIKTVGEFTAANGSKFIAKPANICIQAYNKNYDYLMFFTSVLPKHTPIILGQIGFFDHFRLLFDFKNRDIGIE